MANGATAGDCLGDGVREQGKDPSKYTLIKNSDGTISFTSDGYPSLKMTKQSELQLGSGLDLQLSTGLEGTWMGRVPGIIKVTVSLSGSDKANLDVSVIGHTDIKCDEAITETDSLITFPNGATTGDCLGDGVRGQGKDPSKYTLIKNSDGTISFTSDGYPSLKMTKQSAIIVV